MAGPADGPSTFPRSPRSGAARISPCRPGSASRRSGSGSSTWTAPAPAGSAMGPRALGAVGRGCLAERRRWGPVGSLAKALRGRRRRRGPPDHGGWQQAATPYNHGDGNISFGPALANVNGDPLVLLHRGRRAGCRAANSRRGAAASCGSRGSSRHSATRPTRPTTPSDALTRMETFGLPYRSASSTASEGRSTPPPPSPGRDGDVLLPVPDRPEGRDLYGYRPYATAGTPLPRVRGDGAYFVTEPPATTRGRSR